MKGTESESGLPESLARCHGKREEFVLSQKSCPILVLVHRGCQNKRAEKGQRDELCHRRCQKEFHPMCQTLKKQHHSDHSLQREDDKREKIYGTPCNKW